MSSTSKASTKKKGGNWSSSNKIQNKLIGKIGPPSSKKKSDNEISAGDMVIYKAIQAKLDGEKRAKAASQNEGKLF
jgi:hypothetical protein